MFTQRIKFFNKTGKLLKSFVNSLFFKYELFLPKNIQFFVDMSKKFKSRQRNVNLKI